MQRTTARARCGGIIPTKKRKKIPGNIISRHARARFAVSRVDARDCFPHLPENLFPLAFASVRRWIKVLRPRMCFRKRARARVLSTLLNSFLYYVFSRRANVIFRSSVRPSLCLPSSAFFFLRRATGRQRFSRARARANTPGNKYSRTNCLCHLTSRASGRCNDLITITYKNAQHVDPVSLLSPDGIHGSEVFETSLGKVFRP